jgi:hypothetical protein
MRFDGAKGMRVDAAGDLILRTKGGEVRQPKPIIYQEVAGGRQIVDGGYVLKGREVRFAVGAHDTALPLVIDPTLSYATYLGGNNLDQTFGGMAIDPVDGNVVVTGRTNSSNFPRTAGVWDNTLNGLEAFVTKLNATGTGLVYSTFLGGSGNDEGFGVAVDAAGNVFVSGNTSGIDFPTTPGAFRPIPVGAEAFVAKLNPTGTALLYSTYLGGGSQDYSQGPMAIDAEGNAYVIGQTGSTNFPVTANAFQSMHGGSSFDGFLVKVNSTGSTLLYSTYFGGSNLDMANGVAVDTAGNVYAAGLTFSTNFPTTPGAFQTVAPGGGTDGFVLKIAPSGAVVYSTYIGGSSGDNINRVVADASGSAWVAGQAQSLNFPTTAGAFRAVRPGTGTSGVIAKLNPEGTGLVYSTYFGGTMGFDSVLALAVDAQGLVYATGYASSPDLPVTLDAHQGTHGGGSSDAFLAVFDPTLSSLTYSTFLGGPGDDFASGIVIGGTRAYIVGTPGLSGFPTTAGAYQPAGAGQSDMFIAKFDIVPPIPPTADAGPDQVLNGCAGCFSSVVLDGSASTSPNGPLTFTWRLGAMVLASSPTPVTVVLPVGIHTITVTVGDGSGQTATDTVGITVVDAVAAGGALAAQLQASLDAANDTIEARDVTIAGQLSTIASQVATIAARDTTIAGLQNDLLAANAEAAAHVATIADRDATIASQVTTIAQRDATIAGLQSDLATANTANAALQISLTAANDANGVLQLSLNTANATIASHVLTIAGLQGSLATCTASTAPLQAQVNASQQQVTSLTTMLQQAFNSPSFVIPGATPAQQLQAITNAIVGLNHGQRQAFFKNLGGK